MKQLLQIFFAVSDTEKIFGLALECNVWLAFAQIANVSEKRSGRGKTFLFLCDVTLMEEKKVSLYYMHHKRYWSKCRKRFSAIPLRHTRETTTARQFYIRTATVVIRFPRICSSRAVRRKRISWSANHFLRILFSVLLYLVVWLFLHNHIMFFGAILVINQHRVNVCAYNWRKKREWPKKRWNGQVTTKKACRYFVPYKPTL